jgi:opacity protein-like surface antigen
MIMRTAAAFSLLLLASSAFTTVCTTAAGQERIGRRSADRSGAFEAGFALTGTDSVDVLALGGAQLDVDNDVGYSFWGGYNFGPHWALEGEALYENPDYTAQLVLDDGTVDRISTSLDISTLHVKGVYNILDRSVSPFIELGAGWTRLDSNIVTGPPSTGCWFDPWWGFICANFFDTYTETRPSYEGAVGVRWDISNGMLLRASYGRMEIDTSDHAKHANMNMVRIGTAWKF